MLYFGSSPKKPKLRLPWLVSHMIVIIITTIIFICWTFITFFIDLLVTIVFPVLSGLVLGISILLWRLVHTIHNNYQGDTVSDATNTSDIKIGWSWSLRGSSCDKSKLTEMSWRFFSHLLVYSWSVSEQCIYLFNSISTRSKQALNTSILSKHTENQLQSQNRNKWNQRNLFCGFKRKLKH